MFIYEEIASRYEVPQWYTNMQEVLGNVRVGGVSYYGYYYYRSFVLNNAVNKKVLSGYLCVM